MPYRAIASLSFARGAVPVVIGKDEKVSTDYVYQTEQEWLGPEHQRRESDRRICKGVYDCEVAIEVSMIIINFTFSVW